MMDDSQSRLAGKLPRSGPASCWMLRVNTLRPRQNGRHFPDDIFKCIFCNANVRIWIQFSLKFVPNGPIDNKPALVQVMTRRLFGAKPLPEPMLSQFTDTYAALRGDESCAWKGLTLGLLNLHMLQWVREQLWHGKNWSIDLFYDLYVGVTSP